ncbi:MAG: hypothetical protein C0417_02555 [Chlorobiaceae bacterium]|nr:hypothetical protein [Chlorobiaceae bacterium]
MIDNPIVSIIVVSYNNLDVLRGTLASLLHHVTGVSSEIILVDNASHEPIVESIQKEFPQILIVANKHNLGFGAANNIGARIARGEYLLFVNSDVILKGNPVQDMIKIFVQNPHAGIVGCQLFNMDGTLQPSYFRFPSIRMRFIQLSGLKTLILKIYPRLRFKYSETLELDFVSGAFFMINRLFFYDIHCFDDRYFMYLEDADLGYQVKRKGKRSLLFQTRDVIHIGMNYEAMNNPFVLFHMNDGYLKFFSKNYGAWKYFTMITMSLLLFSVKMIFTVLHENGTRERQQIKRLLSIYYRALFNRSYGSVSTLKRSAN